MRTFSERFAEIPTRLVQKVNGVATEEGFVHIGRCIVDEIEKATGNLSGAGDILDFGCGLGRVTAQLLDRAPRADFVAFDIDPLMLMWAGVLLEDPRVRLVSTTLELPDASMDLVVGISVFTHLNATTDYWLAEIHRILRPAGRAFVTYHDETLFREMAGKGEIEGVAPDAALDGRHVVGGDMAEGGAEMGTFYTTKFWESLIGRYFAIEKTIPRGLFGHQSYSLIRKKEAAIDRALLFRGYALAVEKQLFDLRKQHTVFY